MRPLSAAWRVLGGLVVFAVLTSGCTFDRYQEHPFNKLLNDSPLNREAYGNLAELEFVVDEATGAPVADARCLVVRAPATYECGWAGHPKLRDRGKPEFLVCPWSGLNAYAYKATAISCLTGTIKKQYDHWLFVWAAGYRPVYLAESSRYYKERAPGEYVEEPWPGFDAPTDPTSRCFTLYPRTAKLVPEGPQTRERTDLAAVVKATLPEKLWTDESELALNKVLGISP